MGVGIILRRGLYFENSFSDLPQPLLPSYYYSIVLAIAGYFCYGDVVYHANNNKNKKIWYSSASTVCVVTLILVGGTMSYYHWYLSTAPLIIIVTTYFVITAMYALNWQRLIGNSTIIKDGLYGMLRPAFGWSYNVFWLSSCLRLFIDPQFHEKFNAMYLLNRRFW
jgi:hypothetical protein